jgi:hypothetical protein
MDFAFLATAGFFGILGLGMLLLHGGSKRKGIRDASLYGFYASFILSLFCLVHVAEITDLLIDSLKTVLIASVTVLLVLIGLGAPWSAWGSSLPGCLDQSALTWAP